MYEYSLATEKKNHQKNEKKVKDIYQIQCKIQ